MPKPQKRKPVRPQSKRRTERTRGSFELARLGLTHEQLAARLGKSRVQVTRWVNGERKPAVQNRHEIAAEFGIEPEAFDEPLTQAATPPAAATNTTPDDVPVRQRALELQRNLHDLMVSVRDDFTATPLEKAKVYASAATTLQLLGKLTGDAQEIGEARILRLPAWRKIQERLVSALQPFPKAAVAVADALRELGE